MMLNAKRLSVKWLMVALALAVVFLPGKAVKAQHAPTVHAGYTPITGLVDDWSHHHVAFSNPGTEEDAIKHGRHEQWLKTVNDPRYVLQQLKRNSGVKGPAADDVAFRQWWQSEMLKGDDRWQKPGSHGKGHGQSGSTFKRDWGMGLGGSNSSLGGMAENAFPAKYSFSTTSANCSDYVAFTTGPAGGSTQATIIAFDNLYDTTCSGSVPSIAWAFNTPAGGSGSATADLSPVLSLDGTQIAFVESETTGNFPFQTTAGYLVLVQLAGATSTPGGTIGSPATINYVTNANYRTCTTTGIGGGAGNYPCYTTFELTNGSGTGENDTNSSPYYDYTNDVLYVGDNGGYLHQFTNVFGSGTPAENTAGAWPVRQTSCAAGLTSPVVDPVSGNIFFGSSSGYLCYTNSAASTTRASGHLAGGAGIADAPLIDISPDETSSQVYAFVGDDNSSFTGSHNSGVYQLSNAFSSGNTGTEQVLTTTGNSSTPIVYSGAFDNLHYDIGTTGGNLYACGQGDSFGHYYAVLYQIPISGFGTSGNPNVVGSIASTSGNSTCAPLTEFLGSSANTTLSAALGATGNPSLTSRSGMAVNDYLQIDSEIMQITALTPTLRVTRGALGTTAAAHLGGAAVQDIQDWVYASVTAYGDDTGCNGHTSSTACLYNYSVTTGTAPSSATAGIAETGGTSGVVIDNSLTGSGESQVYFTTLGSASCTGNGTTGTGGSYGCAIQVSQSGLQ